MCGGVEREEAKPLSLSVALSPSSPSLVSHSPYSACSHGPIPGPAKRQARDLELETEASDPTRGQQSQRPGRSWVPQALGTCRARAGQWDGFLPDFAHSQPFIQNWLLLPLLWGVPEGGSGD